MLFNRFYFIVITNQLTLRQNVMVYRSCTLKGYNFFGRNTVLSNCEIGIYTYFGENCKINNLSIGNYCSIGNDVKIGISNHPIDCFVSTSPYFYIDNLNNHKTFVNKNYYEPLKPIEIGNDVFIGSNVIIMDGVKIGDGAVIGVGSIVLKDVASYSVVGGVPAKEIKKRFNEEYRKKLLASKWWDKDINWIRENVNKFHDISKFLK